MPQTEDGQKHRLEYPAMCAQSDLTYLLHFRGPQDVMSNRGNNLLLKLLQFRSVSFQCFSDRICSLYLTMKLTEPTGGFPVLSFTIRFQFPNAGIPIVSSVVAFQVKNTVMLWYTQWSNIYGKMQFVLGKLVFITTVK